MDVFSYGVTGLGGYAGGVCTHIQTAEAQAEMEGVPRVRLAAVVEPNLSLHAEKVQRLRDLGIAVHDNFDAFLNEKLDAIWLPLPIDLHRSYTEQVLAAGKPVLVEKPAAGCIDDVDAMILARDRAKLPVGVNFQTLYDPAARTIKKKLLAGIIGAIQSASVVACWPRSEAYFSRTGWAGKFKRNGVWVLDSPANNALAHFVNLPLFLLGNSEDSSAVPDSVEAELYRVNPIENYDTCMMRYTLPGGVPLLVAFTHACERNVQPMITITGEKGVVKFYNASRYEVWSSAAPVDVPEETIPTIPQLVPRVARKFAARVTGMSPGGIATLENARAHTIAVNGASDAARVHSIPEVFHGTGKTPDGSRVRTVPGIEDALLACANDGKMLHQSHRVKWSAPAGKKGLSGYAHFSGKMI